MSNLQWHGSPQILTTQDTAATHQKMGDHQEYFSSPFKAECMPVGWSDTQQKMGNHQEYFPSPSKAECMPVGWDQQSTPSVTAANSQEDLLRQDRYKELHRREAEIQSSPQTHPAYKTDLAAYMGSKGQVAGAVRAMQGRGDLKVALGVNRLFGSWTGNIGQPCTAASTDSPPSAQSQVRCA